MAAAPRAYRSRRISCTRRGVSTTRSPSSARTTPGRTRVTSSTEASDSAHLHHRSTNTMTEPGTTAQDILRGDILAMGCDDFVSMADVEGRISRGRLAESLAERQQLVVDTVRSLLVDGLIEVGVIPSRNNP